MILLIDDEPAVLASLRLMLLQRGQESKGVATPAAALEVIERQRPDLVLLDMNFSSDTSGREGLRLLSQILAHDSTIPVILITGWATIDLAIAGMKAGARDFVSKPWRDEQLWQTMQTILSLDQPSFRSGSRRQLDERFDFAHLIGEDPAFLRVLETIGSVAPTDASVLLLGESGTGKEMIAEAIHLNSRRRDQPFVKVNLGGITPSLFESEMFGHKKGAFTDAHYDRKGRFELAHTGTIFLDEIGELEPAGQVKLLRVLQDRSFEILGSSHTQRVDVRVISATNRDLAEEVGRGHFREDLFYRINLITVRLPALRERPSDIPRLVDFYLQNLKLIYERPGLTVGPGALDWLQTYSFPGNIRQLKNLVERTVLLSPRDLLTAEDFRAQLQEPVRKAQPGELPPVGSMSLEEMEKEMILKTMQHYQNKIPTVAAALGLSRSALYRRLEKYGIASQYTDRDS